jgi:hypothetical protein
MSMLDMFMRAPPSEYVVDTDCGLAIMNAPSIDLDPIRQSEHTQQSLAEKDVIADGPPACWVIVQIGRRDPRRQNCPTHDQVSIFSSSWTREPGINQIVQSSQGTGRSEGRTSGWKR